MKILRLTLQFVASYLHSMQEDKLATVSISCSCSISPVSSAFQMVRAYTETTWIVSVVIAYK